MSVDAADCLVIEDDEVLLVRCICAALSRLHCCSTVSPLLSRLHCCYTVRAPVPLRPRAPLGWRRSIPCMRQAYASPALVL